MAKVGFSDVIIGTQYGDEGKARVVDNKAQHYDIIARFNGGANAGHTIVNQGKKIALNQVPSGVFHPEKLLYVGSGCVVNLVKLQKELTNLKNAGLDVSGRFFISPQAGIIQPHHSALDGIIGKIIGTTRNGIGPAYADRALRMWGDNLLNIRIGDLLDNESAAFERITENLSLMSKIHNLPSELSSEIAAMKEAFAAIRETVCSDTLFLERHVASGKTVLFEGAQAFMLDVNKGSVPFVTSSSTSTAAAYSGGDLPIIYHRHTFGIAKVIMSRVGHGPFASEFGGAQSEKYCMAQEADGSPKYSKDLELLYPIDELLQSENDFEMGKAVRVLSGEYGTVTSRPRRVGALDLVQLAYAVKTNGITKLILTKCDLLNIYKNTHRGLMPLVTSYELDGKIIDYVPSATSAYSRVKPVIEYLDTFTEDISKITDEKNLPSELKAFIAKIEQFAGCEVEAIGTGPNREQYLDLK